MTQLELIGHLDAAEIAPEVFVVSAHGPLDGRIAGSLRDVLMPLAAADGSETHIPYDEIVRANLMDDGSVS